MNVHKKKRLPVIKLIAFFFVLIVEGIGLEPMTRSFQHAFEVTLFYTNILLWNIEQSVIFIYTALPTELSLHKIKDIIE